MTAVRDAIGLLRLGAVAELAAKEERTTALKVPGGAASASSDKERREIIAKSWVEQVSKTHLLKQDKPDTFISRKGRKVGVHTAQERDNGWWEFSFPERSLNVLVLLAEDAKGFLSDYVIPPKILQEHWKQFEREQGEKGATVLIKLKKDTGGASILLEQSNLPIQQYLGATFEGPVELLITFEAERGLGWLHQGLDLVPLLDRRSASCVLAMAGKYRRLLERIAAEPTLVLRGRLSLRPWEKGLVLARSLAGSRT